ncbi:thiamine pyrophosphate-binding protein [Actinomadura sp.]|uniref:thiamine pyrophosphate-binding protein n=1 Tax=Actinomadura sp. TaxID=1989 RepID=UPI00335F3EA6
MSSTEGSAATVARRYLEMFGELGVTRIFGLPGVHNLAFWRDWSPGMPEIVGVRHEQTTVYAADGLARATGGLGAALVTTGPGAANAVGAFGEAAACGTPVVLVASEIPSPLARPGTVRGALHESRDQAGLFEPLAKAVYRPRTAAAAVEALREAAATALAWPRGPVYVDVPTDVLSQPAELPPAPPAPRRAQAGAADVARLARLLADRERVVIWAGGGVLQSGAEPQLARLAERLDAPVITTYAARGVLGDHPCAVGLPPHEPEVAELVAGADLMLAVGTGFDGMMTRNWRMPMPPELAVINCSAADLDKNYRPDLAVLGDAAGVLSAVLDRVPARDAGTGRSLRAVREAVWSRLAGDPRSADAVAFLRSVEAAITDDTVVVCDMAVPGYWYGGYGRVGGARRLQYPVGWGTLGFALPASLGPAAAGRQVLTVCGDGGFLFAAGELATMAQYRMPVTVLVVDDSAYGMLRYDQEAAGDPIRGVELNSPRWGALGDAFGIEVREADGVGAELEKALRDSLASGLPGLVITRTALQPPRTTSPRWFE